MNCDEYIPADMILLKSSSPDRSCLIESKNLDGETNLNQKAADKLLSTLIISNDLHQIQSDL